MKKLISLALAAMLLLGLAAPAMAADSDFVLRGDGILTQYNGQGGDVVIPDEVTSIAQEAFSGNTSITSVTIPSSVKYIQPSTFSGCTSLVSAIIPSTMYFIYNSAFEGCTSLKYVIFLSGYTEFAYNTFSGCTNLTDIYFAGTKEQWAKLEPFIENDGKLFPEGVNPTIHYNSTGPDNPGSDVSPEFVIEDGVLTAYNGPGGNVVIPDGVTKIGGWSFVEKTEVTGVTIPKGVTEIGEFAFDRCSNLASVSIPSSVTLIGGYAFSECSSLKSVTIPEGVTELGGCAFRLCTSLTSVTLPTSVTKLGGSVFSSCTGITSFTIPATLIDPGAYSFSAGPNLTDVYYGGTEEQWIALNGVSSIQEAKEFNRLGIGDATVHYNSTGPDASADPTPAVSFSDVAANAYYAEPVAWAIEKGITNGTSKTTFSPDKTCNTAEILTFLWRASGEPEAADAGLTDVKSTDYYYGAAQWAKSKGMISGDTLSPETPCTRASTVLFMWQAAGSPTVDTKTSFTDVPADADYAMAVAWAVEKGVTTGTSSTAFSPDQTCTRGQIAAFLYRAFA